MIFVWVFKSTETGTATSTQNFHKCTWLIHSSPNVSSQLPGRHHIIMAASVHADKSHVLYTSLFLSRINNWLHFCVVVEFEKNMEYDSICGSHHYKVLFYDCILTEILKIFNWSAELNTNHLQRVFIRHTQNCRF